MAVEAKQSNSQHHAVLKPHGAATLSSGTQHQERCRGAGERGGDQACAFTGNRNGAPSRLKAFMAAIVIVRSTRSFGANAAAAAA